MAQGHQQWRVGKMTTKKREQRDAEMWQAWIDGKNPYQLGAMFDMSPTGARKAIDRLREKYGQLERTDRETMRQRLIGSALDTMAHLAELMHGDPIPAYSNGKPVLDADGNIALDYSARINAAKALLMANKRLADLTGADAPSTVEITVTAQAQLTAEEAAEQALARIMGADFQPRALPTSKPYDDIIDVEFTESDTHPNARDLDPVFAADDPT